MTARTKKPKKLSLKDAFEAEYARRQAERREREEAERRQQEQDLEHATELEALLAAEPGAVERLSADVTLARPASK